MKRMFHLCIVGLTFFVFAGQALSSDQPIPGDHDSSVPPALGGVGGVYLLASPGELVVDVCKRDLNRRGSRAELRAILVGPDRHVIQEAILPDDGQPRGSGWGPLQQTRLSTHVDRKGVYAVNITVSQDRYGEETVWGFSTNCPRYVIETSRGHKDERHQEPIVLLNPEAAGDVCFRPRSRPFAVEVTGLPKSVEALTMYDGQGQLLQTMPVDAQGSAAHTFAGAARPETAPWRLHLPAQQATVHIDGVTRWDENDLARDLSCWTTAATAYFPWLDYRWLLTPYSRTVYARAGEQAEVTFRVHNNSDQSRTIQLAIEFPDGSWPVELSSDRVALGGKQSAEVTVRCAAPGDGETRTCHLRATPVEDAEFTTYGTLEIRTGEAPATKPLTMPLVLKPYQHENEQFGYLPDYPVDQQVYFDLQNQPFICLANAIATLHDGHWATSELRSVDETGKQLHYSPLCTKLAFDRENRLYALASTGGQPALLHSADGGQTLAACVVPGLRGPSSAFDIEQHSGHNTPDGPPPVLRHTHTASDPKLFWRRLHNLELFLPQRVEGRLVMGEPILISQKCIGLASHSGIPSSVVSRDGKVHVVWGEATEPGEKVPGVPTFVVTCDQQSGKLSQPALVGYGAPPNDIHNSPSITMDSQGYLHVLAGTHGRPFQYARSLQPNDAAGGWTEAEPVGKDLSQTYIGLVCGPDDSLHLVYRLWRYGEPPHAASHHATLAYQRKRPGEPWEEPRILVVPPLSEYSVYYHRLTIDRRGRLFLSYDYWSTFWFYRNDQPGRRRSLLMSADGGTTWKLAETSDFQATGF